MNDNSQSADEKQFFKDPVGATVNYAENIFGSLTPVDMSTQKRSNYPRPNNVGNLSGTHSYPSSITGDPLGFVNYMPYPHGKPQAGMNDAHHLGMYGQFDGMKNSTAPNPLQVNLHMPSDLTDSVSAKWDTGDDLYAKATQMGGLEALVRGSITQVKEGAKQKFIGGLAEKATGGRITKESVVNSTRRQKGVAIRPFESQYFQGVDYRTFSFRHKMIAFGEDETKTINKIIKLFRYHSSPGLSISGVMYSYPSTWRIRFFQADPRNKMAVKESEWLPSLKRCVLESVEVNNFASGTPSYHKNLAPVDIDVSLTFREMEYITKKSILNETQPEW